MLNTYPVPTDSATSVAMLATLLRAARQAAMKNGQPG